MRDLLDLEIDVAELLPADGASYGFDNIAGVLGVSPTLLERYLAAARKNQPRGGRTSGHRRPPRRSSASPATCRRTTGWRGCRSAPAAGGAFRHVFPEDADYAFRIRLARNAGDNLAVFEAPHTLEVSLDGALVRTFIAGGPPPADAPRDSGRAPRMAGPAADHRPAIGSSAFRSRPGRTSCA